VGGFAQAQALNAQASFAVSMAEINQRFAAYRAADVLRQGDQQADRIRQQGLKVQGAQRASAAAQGIRVDDGSAEDATLDTRELSADDQITTRNNAWREAYGLQVQAQTNVQSAKLQAVGAKAAGASSLLGGALSSMSSFGKAAGYLSTSKLPVKQASASTSLGLDLTASQNLKMPGQDNDAFNGWWIDGDK
jgi:hypothetical protein